MMNSSGRVVIGPAEVEYVRVVVAKILTLSEPCDREDVAQDALIQVHRRIHQFRGDAKLTTWIYAVTRSICLIYLRRLGRRIPMCRACPDPNTDTRVDPRPTPEEHALARERMAAVVHRAAQLCPSHSEAMRLYVTGATYREIATAQRCGLPTARMRTYRALYRMRSECQPEENS